MKLYKAHTKWVCTCSSRHPLLCLAIVLSLSLPAFLQIKKVTLDSNLIRLLPKDSQVFFWSEKLKQVISYGDYFTLLFESENTNQLEGAVRKAARDIENLNEGYMIQYQRPIDLIQKYRYLLISSEMLTSISGFITRLKFVTDDKGHTEIISLIEDKLDSLGLKSFSPYFRSDDGQLYGMIIRPSQRKKI
jgi:predicted RND superfamily exporter protein